MEPGRGQKCDVNDLLQFNLLTRKKALGACLGVGTSLSRFQQGEKQGTNQGRERRSATLGVAPLRNKSRTCHTSQPRVGNICREGNLNDPLARIWPDACHSRSVLILQGILWLNGNKAPYRQAAQVQPPLSLCHLLGTSGYSTILQMC